MFSNADQNFLISFPPTTTFVVASEGERTSRVYARVQVYVCMRAHDCPFAHACKLRWYLFFQATVQIF